MVEGSPIEGLCGAALIGEDELSIFSLSLILYVSAVDSQRRTSSCIRLY